MCHRSHSFHVLEGVIKQCIDSYVAILFYDIFIGFVAHFQVESTEVFSVLLLLNKLRCNYVYE